MQIIVCKKSFFCLFQVRFINDCIGGVFNDAGNTVFAVCLRCVSLGVHDAASVGGIKAETELAALIDVDLKRCVSLFLRYAVFHQQ